MTRRFFANNQGILSTESEDPSIPAGGDDTGSEEALATVMAEGEAAEAEADAAVDEANVADGLDGVIALENMRLTLRAANENGGMDRFGAMMAKQHADFILQKFLKSPAGLTMPSNESFGGAGSRVGAGVLTMESIKDSAKKIWDAITKFLKKMKDKVMVWINKMFGAAEALAKRADAIAKRADTAKGSAKEKTFDAGSLFDALAVKETVTGAVVKAGMDKVALLSEEMITGSVDANKFVTEIVDIMSAITPDTAPKVFGEVSALEAKQTKPQHKVPEGEELPGNVKLRLPALKDAGQASQRLEGYGLPTNGAKAKAGAKIPTLSLDEVKSLCATVKKISDSLVAGRKVEADSEKAYKKLNEFAAKQTQSSDMEDSDNSVHKGAHADLVTKFKQVSGVVDGPIKALAGYCMKTARASLDYCDASLGQY